MSLELYSLIPGQQVKRDRDLSNVTIQCDPRAVYPQNPGAVDNRFRKREAGKIAVEDDICNLNVANLTVNGKLIVNPNIPAEICNIFCPEDFTVLALDQILLTAASASNVLDSSGVEIKANNILPTVNPSATQSGATLNVLPQVAGAKGLSVVTTHDTADVHAIAADLLGSTILRASGTAGTNIGATGHLLFSPADDEDPSIAVTADPGTSTASFVGTFATDSCGQIRITNAGAAGALTARVTFQKNYPTNILNVFLTPASRDAAAVMGLPGTLHVSATNFDYFEVSYASLGGGETVDLNYFVVDAVPPAWQLG